MASVSASTSVDLSRLDPPTIVEQTDFETIFARLVGKVRELLPTFDATVDSDPAVKVLQVAAYEQLLQRQEFNERLVGRLVAFASEATLDHIGAAIGVARLIVTPADDITGAPAVYEADDDFRQRIVLGPEGFAAAGPELAYVKHAKDASGLVLDASASSPAPGEVEVTVLSREGDGTASDALLALVAARVTDRAVRPLGDLVSVISARHRPFAIVARIFTFAGPDAGLVLDVARAKLDAYLAASRRLGRDITMSGLYAAMTVEGVQRVEILAPLSDIVCDLSEAARCTSIDLTHAGYAD